MNTALCVAYRKYCNGLKKADCVLVNKSRNSNCDFMKFITEPPVPRKRPDLTTFIHRPLQHFREILKHMQMIASHCRVDSEEQINFNSIINELQTSYREITVGGGLMEPIGEGLSRDRVLFITEEPISLSTVTDSCFNIRKKGTEFRLTIDPSGRQIESPTVHCAPDLTRTPKKNLKKRYVVLRAPSTELKAVWQNLLTRQM
ncbi:Protostome-specific GEF [Anopheles darlingi]|uniref:Protostome-specific GEF n=1 Tax=Anopheles darlingi TaxID=43151 RepID=W5JVL7_ANODA|nr:Protostome-specific GEF [Anopheles darlingi]